MEPIADKRELTPEEVAAMDPAEQVIRGELSIAEFEAMVKRGEVPNARWVEPDGETTVIILRPGLTAT